MEDFDLNIVAKKSVKSMFALVSRTFLVQILGIIASLVLTIYLSPANFGIFFIVSSIVVFLNYFSDIGLAASLIQKKEEPTVEELRTTFTVQQILVLAIILPSIAISPFIEKFFHINNSGLLLFYAFLISFFLSSLKTIPTILLERRLDFHKLVIPQIAENVVYNVVLIVLAVNGFGVTSFTVAVFLRAVVGLVLMYYVSPWPVGLAYNKQILKRLLSFGLPFQVNSLLGLIKDDLINVFIGKILPLAQVGYIGFAQKWAFLPLRLVMDNVIKIIFPSFSRLQHDKEALKKVIEVSLFMISLFIIPTAVGFIMLSPYFLDFVPKYHKWEPAYISVVFFALNTIFGSLSTPITNFLYAIGKVKITLYFMAFWTALIWILTPLLIKLLGFNGVSIASFLVSISTLSIYFVARRYVSFSFIKPVIKPALTSIIMAGFIFVTKPFINSLALLLVEVIASAAFYFFVIFILTRREMAGTFSFIRQSIKEK